MIKFDRAIEEQMILKITPNPSRAKNLQKQSKKSIATAKNILLTQDSAGSILREVYEGIRQYAESLGYILGYKFQSHEILSVFIEEKIGNRKLALEFNRLRKLRNGLNYYGDDVHPETITTVLTNVSLFIDQFEVYERTL